MFFPRCVRPLHLLHPHDKLKVITVPCGKCIACRIRYASGWALRCLMEYHACGRRGVFLTLTHDDEHCPFDLSKRALQLFLKRFRKTVGRIRYLAVGEYGGEFGRPHYHILVFGLDEFHPLFKMFRPCVGQRGLRGRLADWPDGFVHLGYVEDRSCMYVCKYAIKDVPENQLHEQQPFMLMSRRPGLGYAYMVAHRADIESGRDKCVRYTGKFFPSLPTYIKRKFDEMEEMTNFDASALQLAFWREMRTALQSARYELDLLSRCPSGELPERYEQNQNVQRERDIAGRVEVTK